MSIAKEYTKVLVCLLLILINNKLSAQIEFIEEREVKDANNKPYSILGNSYGWFEGAIFPSVMNSVKITEIGLTGSYEHFIIGGAFAESVFSERILDKSYNQRIGYDYFFLGVIKPFKQRKFIVALNTGYGWITYNLAMLKNTQFTFQNNRGKIIPIQLRFYYNPIKRIGLGVKISYQNYLFDEPIVIPPSAYWHFSITASVGFLR